MELSTYQRLTTFGWPQWRRKKEMKQEIIRNIYKMQEIDRVSKRNENVNNSQRRLVIHYR